MMKIQWVLGLGIVLWVSGAVAEPPSPYVGQQHRAIKALSTEDVENYLSGRGAGMAKAAELNHYPGPAHVLSLAKELRLSADQKAKTQAIFNSMQQRAIRHGKELVEKERELDLLFSSGSVTPDSLNSTLQQIAAIQAEVRRSHLEAHLEQKNLLTQEQVARYDELRGYNQPGGGEHSGHQHNH